MPVPASINDLSTTAASNYPQGSEPALPLMDDYMRAIQSFVAFLRDNKLNTSAVSSFIMTLLDDADAATARTTLGAAGLGANTFTGAQTLPGNATNPLHAMPLQQATGRLLGVRVFTTSDSGTTYTPTTGTTSVIVQAVGGGGSGGGNEATTSSNADCAAGGSAGRYGMGRYTSSFSGVTLTVGGGGVGIAGGFGTGGGTTSFGSLLSCPGGNSGSRTGLVGLPGTALAGHPAEAPAATGANIFDTAGSKGSHGFILGNGSLSGQGGSSPFGSGGAAVVPGAAPANGSGYGSGGGGVVSTNSGARAGGNGSPGVIIVYEYA